MWSAALSCSTCSPDGARSGRSLSAAARTLALHALGRRAGAWLRRSSSVDAMLRLQILLLDLGLLVSLYAGWRIVRSSGGAGLRLARRAARALAGRRPVALRGGGVDLPPADGHAGDGPLSIRPARGGDGGGVSPGRAGGWPDGGVVRLRETEAPSVVTVFTAPDPLPGGIAADVERPRAGSRGCGDPGRGCDRSLRSARSATTRASPFALRSQATNKLLQAAQVDLGEVGEWRLGVSVSRAGQAGDLSCPLPIAPATRRVTALWDVFALPPLMVGPLRR